MVLGWLLNKFFDKRKKNPLNNKEIQNNEDKNIIDIVISLTPNYEIDLSIILNITNQDSAINLFSISQKCADFFNIINMGKLKPQMINMLINNIKNENNQLLIDNILIFWALLEKEIEEQRIKSINNDYIPPSQVFAKYLK